MHTISCILILSAIFLPWLQVRSISLNHVYVLCTEHINSHSLSYSYIVGDYLQRFEITTSYLSSFADEKGIVRCDPDHMFYFKKFCDNLNQGAVLRPYRYYLAHNITGACQLEYYSVNNDENEINQSIFSNKSSRYKRVTAYNSSFRLFYIFPYNSTHDMTRVYTESTDFKNWNYLTDGKFVNFIESNKSTTLFNRETLFAEPFWTTGLASFGSQNESRVFTIIYPLLEENQTKLTKKKNQEKNILQNNNSNTCTLKNKYWYAKSIQEANLLYNSKTKVEKEISEDDDTLIATTVGSSFFTESLYLILKQKTQAKHFHYLITDYMYNALIDDEMGAIYPKYFNSKNMAIYPNISDINSSLWNSVEKEIISVPNDVPLLVNVSTSVQYMIIKRAINSRSRYSFYLIMLIELNEKMAEIYTLVTNVFAICAILILVIYFSIRFLVLYFKSKLKIKLKIKQKILLDNDFDISRNKKMQNLEIMHNHFYYGTITEAIEKLRIIQLKNVDNIILNNMIDDAIDEITRNSDELYNIKFLSDSTKNKDNYFNHIESCNCPFCFYLIDSNEDFSIIKEKEMQNKKRKEKEIQKMNQIFYYILMANDKNKDIENYEMKNDFYIESKEKMDKYLYSIWNIKMNKILNQKNFDDDLFYFNPQKYLIRKFMKFIQKGHFYFKEFYPDSLLMFIITFTKENIRCYYCKIKSFQLLKRLIKNNFKFWIKSKYDIFILFLALMLRHSKLNSYQVLNLFQSFVGQTDKYFYNLLKVLIDDTRNNNIMNIYGELTNRRQSPNFSVFNNTKDLVLFMKALLIFSDFAVYLTLATGNEMCFTEINDMIFSENEKQNLNFISDFHFEMTKNVVFQWFNLMDSFSPMDEIQKEFNENINYWFKKTHIED